jgi:hypothetical protein
LTINNLENSGEKKIAHSLSLSRMVLPIVLGVGAVALLFYYQFDLEQFKTIAWTKAAFGWIALSFVLLLARHFFYALRMRAITGGFSWKKCIELVVLWEFSAALAPTSKGGPFVMLFVLTREGLSAGRTAAAVFYTMVCDAGFFVLLLPVLLLCYGPAMLYPGTESYGDVGLVSGTFFATYAVMAGYWLFLLTLLVIRPQIARGVMYGLARWSLLRRWTPKLHVLGDEFDLAASEMRRESWGTHLKVILGTVGAWTCKFLMINCLIIAVMPSTPIDGSTQLFVFARLIVMFIMLMFAVTPGGAGIAETLLPRMISDYVPLGIGLVVALIWRSMAYYGYLLAGAIVAPRWLARLKKG